MPGWRDLSKQTADRLRVIWERMEISQGALAERVGLRQSTISQVMANRFPDWRISTISTIATGMRHDVGIVFIPKGQPYQFCGADGCRGRHHFPSVDVEQGVRQLWCHGAPLR